MGGMSAPRMFPQPGALGIAQQGSNPVGLADTVPQPGKALSTFNPASAPAASTLNPAPPSPIAAPKPIQTPKVTNPFGDFLRTPFGRFLR